MATEYRGWRIEVHTDQATDAEGSQRLDAPWRVYVRIHLLERRDHLARSYHTFPSREVAEAAGIAMAETWIDNQAKSLVQGRTPGRLVAAAVAAPLSIGAAALLLGVIGRRIDDVRKKFWKD